MRVLVLMILIMVGIGTCAAFFLQQGRTSNHPESKCNFKKKKADKTPNTTS